MAELELSDLLKLEDYVYSGEPGDVSVRIINRGGVNSGLIDNIPSDENLITKAVKNYLRIINAGGGFTFSIEKNIPSGAGLGGGSGNAAAAIRLVSSAIGGIDGGALLDSASMTGSDVPFFLMGGFEFAEGRGEVLTPVDYSDSSTVILINNGIHVDTGIAYRALNREISSMGIDNTDKKNYIIQNLNNRRNWRELFRNDFEDVIFSYYPALKVLKDELYGYGAFFSAMTGSGSTVFGLFEDEQYAKSLYKKIVSKGNNAFITKFHAI